MSGRLVGAAAAAVLALAGCGQGAPVASRAPAAPPRPPEPAGRPPGGDAATAAQRPVARGDAVVRPRRPVALRATPGGHAVARVGPRTAFGSPRWMLVRARRGGWLGVIAAERPNGRLGWLPAREVVVRSADVRLRVDLSRRTLRLLRDGRVVLRMPVGVGAPATPTPTGRFAVTDGLRTGGAPSPYGCCILALSGHQPSIPQGWAGGDRIAIHGTSAPATIGSAVSLGCLRARDADVRRLMRLTQLGALVEIRA